ncbi:MAG: NAD(P)-dependent alcohol dehydrogenase [Spirochaetaceae bacterium]|nr:MAG: NAD(P)-dependent alcohol dehydrogenase [Spirochaetaceae bacterium]
MKAAIYTKFGPPEVLQVMEVPAPVPKENEVLVRIHATTVEKEDPDCRKGPGFNGILKPKKPILGMELAGEIEAADRNVTRFKTGDKVYGNAGLGLGTYAEYICLPEDGALAIKPDRMSYKEAAAVTNGALTALPFLRDLADIRRGQRILVNGASGSVGTAAIQIAKYYGAIVTGVCSTKNLDMVKSLGADNVIDYTKEDFAKTSETYDIIFDVAGKTSYSRCKHLLSPNGIYLSTVPTPAILLGMLFTSKSRGRKVKFAATGLRKQSDKAKDLFFLKDIIDAGKFRAVIDSSYPLEQIARAHEHVEKGHKHGSVVITIE